MGPRRDRRGEGRLATLQDPSPSHPPVHAGGRPREWWALRVRHAGSQAASQGPVRGGLRWNARKGRRRSRAALRASAWYHCGGVGSSSRGDIHAGHQCPDRTAGARAVNQRLAVRSRSRAPARAAAMSVRLSLESRARYTTPRSGVAADVLAPHLRPPGPPNSSSSLDRVRLSPCSWCPPAHRAAASCASPPPP